MDDDKCVGCGTAITDENATQDPDGVTYGLCDECAGD